MGIGAWLKGLTDRSFDSETARRLPMIDANGKSNVPGLYMVGEIAGTPLINLGLNAGVDAIDHVAAELKRRSAFRANTRLVTRQIVSAMRTPVLQ